MEKEQEKQVMDCEKLIKYLLQRDFLLDFIKGKQKHGKATWEAARFALEEDKPMIFLLGKTATSIQYTNQDEYCEFLLASMQAAEEFCSGKFRVAMFDYDETTMLWLLQPEEAYFADAEKTPIQYIEEVVADIAAYGSEKLKTGLVIFLYHSMIQKEHAKDIFLRMNQHAQENRPKAGESSYGIIFNRSKSLTAPDEEAGKALIGRWETQISELSRCLECEAYQQFIQILKHMIFYSNEIASMHHLAMIRIYQRISCMLIACISRYDLQEQMADHIGLYKLYHLQDFENWREAFVYLENVASVIMELRDGSHQDNNKKMVYFLKEYIQSHLSENLTLTELSEKVNYNSTYISRIFRQFVGMNLSSYIAYCRIEYAKELLSESGYSVREIAEKAGFDTSQYFSKVFKKAVGLSPGEYRIREAITRGENQFLAGPKDRQS